MIKKPKVRFTSTMDVEDLPNERSKSKPKAYLQDSLITDYLIQRERVINDDKSQDYIELLMEKYTGSGKPSIGTNPLKEKFDALDPAGQLQMFGINSAPEKQILTPDQIKAKTQSRFEEDDIVNAWAKWFKVEYPGIPYTIDKVANSRSKFAGAIMSAAAFQRGNPDINVQCQRGGFAALYIEQKVSDDIFYQGTRILKPGSDNRMIWQSLYHAELRLQGYWVMFSISLEASKKITSRYMAGNPYPQQVFEYYCKPEDCAMFEDNKHFKPVEKP